MSKMYLTVGAPASGKSTWAVAFRKRLEDSGRRAIVAERDNLRALVGAQEELIPHGKGWGKSQENRVTEMIKQIIVDALRNDTEVIVADTNLNDDSVKMLEHLAENFNTEIYYVLFRTDKELMFERNRHREGWKCVPDKVIADMHRRITEKWPRKYAAERSIGSGIYNGDLAYGPKVYVGAGNGLMVQDHYIAASGQDVDVRDAVIFDIDGTLAKHVNRSPYDESRVLDDDVYDDIADMADMYRAAGYYIAVMSGRKDSCRKDTETWLDFHSIPYDTLYMRPAEDHSKDSVVKTELFWRLLQDCMENQEEFLNIRYVIDDRNQTVAQWRRMGLRCLQVQDGDF